jgi:DNA-binding CsgD family transcriptional regulator
MVISRFTMTIYLFGYYLVLFAAGIALLLMTYLRYRKTGDPLLRSYALYLLAVSATVFESAVGESFLSLIANSRGLSPASVESFTRILCLLSVPLWFISWYLFLRMIARLMGRDVSRGVWSGYVAAQAAAALAFAVMIAAIASPPSPASSRAFSSAFAAARWIGCFIRFWSLAQIVFYLKGVGDASRRGLVLRFGGMYAVLAAVTYGLLALRPRQAIFTIIYPIAFFLSEYAPLFYILAVSRGEFRGVPAAFRATNALDRLGEARGLTKREQEIVGLILAGKNNVDIHSALFISPGTVRNHVSSIYRKLGLKNRYQLLALARTEGENARWDGHGHHP